MIIKLVFTYPIETYLLDVFNQIQNVDICPVENILEKTVNLY